jgi:hypothetical protein
VTVVDHPELGILQLEPGPAQLFPWRVQRPAASALFGIVEVLILLEGTSELERADLPFVAAVMAQPDDYLEEALRFVHATLRADPATSDLVESDGTADQLQLDLPILVFRGADEEWSVHFRLGPETICGPYGLAVEFDRERPMRVNRLIDIERIE